MLTNLNDDLDFDDTVCCEEFVGVAECSFGVSDDNGNKLSVLHTNIRSYRKNSDNFFTTLALFGGGFDVIVLSETWLGDDAVDVSLDGYDVFKTSAQTNRNDGTLCFVKSSLQAVGKEVLLGDVYGVTIDFVLCGRKLNIIGLYRTHDSDKNTFTDALETWYRNKTNDKTYIFIGDINMDILQNNVQTDKYLNTMIGAGFVSCVNIPTRVTDDSRTCIDHVFVDHSDNDKIRAGVVHTHITDHHSTVLEIQLDPTLPNTVPTDTDRPTYIDKQLFKELLTAQCWDSVTGVADVRASSSNFHDIISNIVEKSTKQIINRSSKMKKLKPWITSGLLTSIRRRDKLSKSIKNQPFNTDLKLYFQNYRNQLNILIKQTKTEYFKQKISNCERNPKLFWQTINEIAGKQNKKDVFPIEKHIQNLNCEINRDLCHTVANQFNDYFANVGAGLAAAIDSGGAPVVNDEDYAIATDFVMHTVTENDVLSYVNSLRGGSAPGCDGVSAALLKDNIQAFMSPLLHIINLSISKGVFPDFFKIAKVIPLYKTNDITCKDNFRPISMLSVFSKILEKIVKDQFVKFLNNNNILSDSVERSTLLNKLELIGCRGISYSWFQSFLSHRQQVVNIRGVNSDIKNIDFGVIQGSTLGPILFLVYINNLVRLNISGKFYLFADDSALLFEGKNWEDVKNKASRDLSLVKKWFDQNILSLNITKTKILPISLSKKSDPAFKHLYLHKCGNFQSDNCNCSKIEIVDSHKYLGVIFDKRLRWEDHVNYIKSKTRKYIYSFRQLGKILSLPELKITYFAYCQSLFLGGNIAWAGAYKTILEPLNVVQKAVLKAALGKGGRFPTDELFDTFGVLTIRQLYIKTLLVFIKVRNTNLFTNIIHDYFTRNSSVIGIQAIQLTKTFSTTNSYYIAHSLYRNVPNKIRHLANCSVFVYKKRVHEWIVDIGRDAAERVIVPGYR